MRHIDPFHHALPVTSEHGAAAFLRWLQDVAGALTDREVTGHTAAEIADVSDGVNVEGKSFGKMVVDITNDRMLYATGSAPSDAWNVVDGSASVAPS